MIAAVTDAVYVVIIVSQGPPYDIPVVAVVFLMIAACAICAALAGSTSRTVRTRTSSAAGATCGLLVLGFLGIFSIGLPLLVAAGFAATAWIKLINAARSETG